MKGLDAYIIGLNNPDAPFNQVDWTEQYPEVLDKCEWITDELLADDETYQKLGSLLGEIIDDILPTGKWFNSKQKAEFVKEHVVNIAIKLKEQYFNL